MKQSFFYMMLILMMVVTTVVVPVAWAQTTDLTQSNNNNSQAPIEIEADEALEWQRGDQTYIARGNAVAKQGEAILRADVLTAHYEEGADGSTQITKMTATGGVQMSNAAQTAYGDQGVYDVQTGEIILTGGDLKIVTPDQVVKAQEKLTYDTHTGQMTAVGHADITHGADRLTADRVTAIFGDNAKTGKMELRKIMATGDVVLRTAKETVKGQSGVYDVATGQAMLEGNVRILQGSNWLEGGKATVNLNTGVSQLVAGSDTKNGQKTGGGRVRGIFYPKSN